MFDYSFTEASSSYLDSAYERKTNSSVSMERSAYSKSFTRSFPIEEQNTLFKKHPKISRFIKEMNKHAAKLGMKNTHFDSPHGLSNKYNYSTAYDVAMLCSVCIGIPDFNRITRTKSYICKPRNRTIQCHTKSSMKDYRWENTNKLLSKGFVGIKTGVTYTAGPCLVTHIK
jgi:hypothetical protein